MENENNMLIESSNGEETDGNIADDGQFMNYENSVFRFRKQKEKEKNGQLPNTNDQAIREHEEKKLKALKAERLLETIRSHNRMSMWQSFLASNNQYAVVFCYERDYLKAWIDLKAVAFDEHYQLTLTEQEIKLTTEENRSCCKRNMQGVSHRKVSRTYRVPRPMDYLKAVWHQTGDVLEICVPWISPVVY